MLFVRRFNGRSSQSRVFLWVALLAIIFSFSGYFVFLEKTYPKRILNRTIMNVSMVATYLEEGKWRSDLDLREHYHSKLSMLSHRAYETSALEQNVSLFEDVRWRLSSNKMAPEDHDNGFVWFILAAWKLFQTYDLHSVFVLMFFLHAALAMMVFSIGCRLGNRWTGLLSFLIYFIFTPSTLYLTNSCITWISGAAVIGVIYFLTQKLTSLKGVVVQMGLCGVFLAMCLIGRSSVLPLIGIVFLIAFFHAKFSLRFFVGVLAFCVPFFGLKSLSDHYLTKAGAQSSSHTIWFPVLVGMTDMFGGSQEDGDGYHLARLIYPDIRGEGEPFQVTPEEDALFRDQVLLWFDYYPERFFKKWKQRTKKILTGFEHGYGKMFFSAFMARYFYLIFLFGSGLIFLRSTKQNKQVFLIILASGSVFFLQGLFISAKNPEYYYPWNLIYIFPAAVFCQTIGVSLLSLVRRFTERYGRLAPT